MPLNYETCKVPGPKTGNGHHAKCTRKKGHLLHPSKYQRQHVDTKQSRPIYWDPTEAEIQAAKEE